MARMIDVAATTRGLSRPACSPRGTTTASLWATSTPWVISRASTGADLAAIQAAAPGWDVAEAEQSYVKGNPYKGVHLQMRDPHGQIAELQVHSRRSQEIKDRAHVLYKISRDPSRPLKEHRAAEAENKQLYADLPAPADLDTLSEKLSAAVSKKAYS